MISKLNLKQNGTKTTAPSVYGWNCYKKKSNGRRCTEKQVSWKGFFAYSINTEWRNWTDFINGRNEVIEFLRVKWSKELSYKLKKELWTFYDNRIAVRFEYKYHNAEGQWFRYYVNENWEFDCNGLMEKRFASINVLPIEEKKQKDFLKSLNLVIKIKQILKF